MMKIVIEIPRNDYERIKKYKRGHTFYPVSARLYESVKEGTPLPKGHGDLIDRKELTKYPPIWMEDKRRTGEDDAVILLSDILKAEAIIEADKAESEEV